MTGRRFPHGVIALHGRASVVALILVAILLVPAGSADAAPSGASGNLALPTSLGLPQLATRELVVRFRSDVPSSRRRALHRAVGVEVLGRATLFGIEIVRIPARRSIAETLRRYRTDARVLSAEPNARRWPTSIPTDPLFDDQWSMRNSGGSYRTSSGGRNQGVEDADIDANAAWNMQTGSNDVVVAVIDEGIDLSHPDLEEAMWTNATEEAGVQGVDDDGNGYVDDIYGWDFKGNDGWPGPPRKRSHGTHVAGVIAAQHGDDGIAGLCPGCRIMPLRFDFRVGQEVRAIEYAVANGADVINMSFGGGVWSPAEHAAIEAAGDAGVLVVASAGNDSLDNDLATYLEDDFAPAFPAAYTVPELMSVAASNLRDTYAYSSYCDRKGWPRWVCSFTSWGHDSVDVAAPGVDIMSTVVVGEGIGGRHHDVWDGTSMAAPHVSGIAGLVLSEHPAFGPLDVKNAIMNAVDEPDSLRLTSSNQRVIGVGRSPLDGTFTRTQGRVNADEALVGDTTDASIQTDGNIDGAQAMGRAVEGRVGWPADVNDVYSEDLDARTRYRVVLDGADRADLDLWVWNRTAQEIWQFELGCFQRHGGCPALRAVSASRRADEAVTFRTSQAGTYFIHVAAWYSGAAYRLVIRRA